MNSSELTYNLSGSVRHMGLPVAGVFVKLFEYWRFSAGAIRQLIDEKKTGARGDFNFAVSPGNYILEIVPDKTTRFLRQAYENMKVSGNTICNINLSTGSLFSGSVRNSAGTKIASCRVLAYAIEPSTYRLSDSIDASGGFGLVLPKGRYYVATCFEERGDACSNNQNHEMVYIAPSLSVIDVDGDMAKDINLPKMVLFTGCVRDHAGAPVKGAKVAINPSLTEERLILADLRIRAKCETDEKGCFAINVEPGLYDLSVLANLSYELAEMKEKAVSIEQDTKRDIVLNPGHRVFGRILVNRVAVKGCLVKARCQEGLSYVVSTNEDGQYNLLLPGGHFEITVSGKADASGKPANVLIAPFNKTINVEKETRLDIELKGGLIVAGKVTDRKGRARTGIRVCAWLVNQSQGTRGDSSQMLASCLTLDDGSYSFALDPGEYKIGLYDDLNSTLEIKLKDDSKELNFTWESGFVVSFEVVNEEDSPVANCKIICLPYLQQEAVRKGQRNGSKRAISTGYANTGSDGKCQMTVVSGVYTFKIEPPGQGSYQAKTIRQLSVGADTMRRVTLIEKKLESISDDDKNTCLANEEIDSRVVLRSLPLFQARALSDE